MLTILTSTPSIIDQYLHELRDSEIQKDRTRFERNLERLGMLAGYELSKQLRYETVDTATPLGIAHTPVLSDDIVVGTVLRAGLPVQRGIHQVLDRSVLAFIGAARHEGGVGGVSVQLGYTASPRLEGKVLIMADTMLASGHSLVESYRALVSERGKPQALYVAAVIAAQPGLDYVQAQLPEASIVACTVDPVLNDRFFIVPGLGDAGDLLYGPKD